MEQILQCECGFVARAESDEELALEIRRHASEAHRMTLSHAQALLLASGAQGSSRHRSVDRKERQ